MVHIEIDSHTLYTILGEGLELLPMALAKL